jgi:hypothetical protein
MKPYYLKTSISTEKDGGTSISAQQDIEHLQKLYREFVDAVNAKVKDFSENKYDTFDEDKNKEAILKNPVGMAKLDVVKQYYAFISLIEDILKLNFIAEIKMTAKKYGFSAERSTLEAYGDYKAFLALEMAGNYPIAEKETYTNSEFRNITFTRPSKIPDDSASIMQVQIVPILKITVDQEKKLQKIEPQSFGAIEAFLKPILHPERQL